MIFVGSNQLNRMKIALTKNGDKYIIYNDFVFQRIECKAHEFNIGQVSNNLKDTLKYLNAKIIK